MDEKLSSNKSTFLESCKPLIVNSNTLYAKSEEINVKCCNKSKKRLILLNAIIASFSLLIFITTWFTDIYNGVILQQIALKNDSDMLSWWLRPPVDPIVKVFIFNYTNIDRFINGSDAKIKVNEIGPYAYREPVEKVNLRFENEKISFYENRTHLFDAKLSCVNLTEDDIVHVPNIPFISAIPNVKKLGFLAEIGFKTVISMTKPQQFQNLDVRKFLFGYRDEFMSLISKIKWDFSPEDVGVLAPRHGISSKRISVNLGIYDINEAGKVFSIDGKSKHNIWKSDKCNEITGRDGALYGPDDVMNKRDLLVYIPEICRSLPMRFREKTSINGIPSFHYTATFDIFNKTINTTTLNYHCELKTADTSNVDGVMDVSDCIDGTPPIFVSFAHFMDGNSKLFEKIEGLKPDRRFHTPHAHIHPRLGIPLFGESRMQLNLKVTSLGKHYEKFDGLILPLAWIQTSVDEFPLRFKFLLYTSTYFVDFIEIVLKYGSIISFLASVGYLLRKFANF